MIQPSWPDGSIRVAFAQLCSIRWKRISETFDKLVGCEGEDDAAIRNHTLLEDCGTFAVPIRGSTGCSKTSLIARTLAELVPETVVAVLTVNPLTQNGTDRIRPYAAEVMAQWPLGQVVQP